MIPLPNGYTAHPIRIEDAETMLALYHAVSLKLIGETEETLDEITEMLEAPSLDLERDTLSIYDANGTLVAFGTVSMQVPQNVEVDLYLHPDLWERDSVVMPYLRQWADARAHDALALVPEHERVTATAWRHHHDDWYAQQMAQIGFETIRSSYQMWIDFNEPLPVPVFPEGVSVRVVSRDEDWQRIYDARREAWHDMWGYVPLTYEQDYAHWREYWDKNFSDGYWYIAEKDGIVIAICLGEPDYNGDPSVTYIATVGVRRAHRQQGLGLALLQHALGQLQGMGNRAACLYVDASSLTGAVRLYERAGMHIKMRFERMEKELRAGFDQRVQVAGV